MAEFTKEELQAELELRRRNKPSNEIDAIIASLTNDEGARIEYLKRKRFPDNPNVIYFKDEDNDLAYIDPTTKEIKKEFREYNDWVDSYDIFGKIIPTVQVGAEIVGGILGLEGGYKGQTINMRGISIPLPKGRLGGAGGGAFGTGLASGVVYTGREIL